MTKKMGTASGEGEIVVGNDLSIQEPSVSCPDVLDGTVVAGMTQVWPARWIKA